jgi:hypothetical protein
MARDLFRGIIRTLLVLCLMGGCVEGCYFMGELSKNQTDRYNPYYNNSRSYTYGNVEEAEEIDYEQINTDTDTTTSPRLEY